LKQIDRQDRFMISLLFVELADLIRDTALDRNMKEDIIKTAFREFSCAVTDFEDIAK
jgi:hypothetical protein